jgi:hypothetical protein
MVNARRAGQRGWLTIEAVVALSIATAALLPLAYSFIEEQRILRACYYRAIAMEIVDGEMEILAAGEWRTFSPGTHPYAVRAESAKNLPPGRFVLTVQGQRLRLEWLPEKAGSGGAVVREAVMQ